MNGTKNGLTKFVSPFFWSLAEVGEPNHRGCYCYCCNKTGSVQKRINEGNVRGSRLFFLKIGVAISTLAISIGHVFHPLFFLTQV